MLRAGDGAALTRRLHGHDACVLVEDQGQHPASTATLLRAAGAVGRAREPAEGVLRVCLEDRNAAEVAEVADGVLRLDATFVASAPVHHPVERAVASRAAALTPHPFSEGTTAPVQRLLAFESLLNSDMEHNDKELSQGVLHLLSPLQGKGVGLARVKMPIVGDERPPEGLEGLAEDTLAGVELILITLLEGYWHGAVALVRHLRKLGCRAHIAVGGVMPTLAPEHVAAHLPEVSFVCRGAGEVVVPVLADVLGGSTVDEPFTDAQLARFSAVPGLLVRDRAGRRLLSCHTAQTAEVTDLDRVALDLRYLEARHVVGGIEITTSRGCLHKCSFCSILGRESYQARSSGSILELLQAYQDRYEVLFEGAPPPNAWRVHIADDDFACDPPRAQAFFRALLDTPFRLSSVQVSVADLCLRDAQGRLLAEVDPAWTEAIRPACFADHGRRIAARDRIEDHRPRGWSSYLQIGVETFSPRELARLGKGYQVEHIRAVVHTLADHDLHHDAYFIQSNSETTAQDLVDSVAELCRLKLRYPLHLHLKFPVVPHLVSYFPTATFRKKVRAGTRDSLALLDHLKVPGHPELDYPLTLHDRPGDPLVAAAVAAGFLTDAGRYTESLARLSALWARPPGHESPDAARRREQVRRRLDDLPRRLVFELLSHARMGERGAVPAGWPAAPDPEQALATAAAVLGPRKTWARAFQRHTAQTTPRLVVIPTWQCELRCSYCWIPKQDGRVMSTETLERSIDFLLSSHRDDLLLQFFGGEALLEYERVQHALEYGSREARRRGKRLSFVLSSNGWSLDEDKLAWLAQFPVKLELSLDGTPGVQNRFRHSRWKNGDSYTAGIAPRAEAIQESGLVHDVIMVVHPLGADKLFENFFHIAGLGFRRLQINPALGVLWRPQHIEAFTPQLFAIGEELKRRWAQGDGLVLINAEQEPMPVRLNGEVTVDWDGTIYGGNAFLHETEHKDRFRTGHLDDATGFDRHWLDGPTNDFLLQYSYPPDVTENNLRVGKLLRSFCLWLRGERGD